MGEGVLQAAGALGVYAQITQAPGVGLLPEPAGCEQAYRQFVQPDLPARLLTDAYLAAFAQSAGLRLVTFDRDFARFAGLQRVELG
jgi:predicted nucleic acid-binding protein